MAHGHGTYRHAGGATYVGQWRGDRQDGVGHEEWPDKASFEGQYQDGMKQGSGKFVYANGSVYEGRFEGNEMNGEGFFRWQNGDTYNGEWRRNVMQGKGSAYPVAICMQKAYFCGLMAGRMRVNTVMTKGW